MQSRLITLLTLVAVTGCSDTPRPNPVRDALAATPPTMDAGTPVGFRLPTSGQRNTRLYRLPSLEEVAWRFEASPRPVETVLGFAGDEDLVYAVTTNRHLVALDLASGRVRTFDSTVTHATLAPTGTVYLVREDSSVAEVARRTVRRWTTRFSAPPSQLHGMVRGRVLGLVEDPEDRRLEILADGQEPTAIAIPAGPVAVAPWGDAAAIAADSGLVILDLRAMDDPRSLPLPTTPSQVGFTASGHRILAVDSTGLLTVIERFELDVIDTLRLPSPIRALRSGPRGRFVLAAASDSMVHVVGLAPLEVVGTLASRWTAELPTVTGDGAVLTRDAQRVAVVDPRSGEARSDVASPAADRWLVADWDPRRPGLELAAEAAETEVAPGALIYVQVSSSHNPAWAEDFASNLRRAGVVAGVLPPEEGEELYRVVLGPHATREAAEATAQRLGLPFWIFSQDTTTTADSTDVPQ